MRTRLRLLALALTLLGVAPALRAFDFTIHRMPQPAGAPHPKTYFLDGDSKIFVDIPSDWTVTDGASSLDCLPPHADCHVRIDLAGSQPWVLDEPGKILLRKKALATLPDNARDVKNLPEASDLVGLKGWSSLEVGHSYEFFGHQLRHAVIFCNLPEKRVWQMTITAPEKDFGDIHEQLRQMLYNLFEPTKMLSGSALERYNAGITD